MKKKLLIALLPLLLLILGSPVAAQSNPTLSAILVAPDGQLTVGDPVALRLEVSHPADYHVIMPDLEGEWGSFLVKDQLAPTTQVNAGGSETTSQVIDVRLFAPGSFVTPAIPITLTDSAGQVIDLIVDPVSVEISSVLVEGDTELRDIKPQAEIPYINYLPWIVTTLGLLLLAGIITLLIRRWRAKRALAAIDNRLPHEVALDELDRIEALRLPDSGRFKGHYTLVSDTLRSYMEQTVDISMMERTTAEIRASLELVELEPVVASQFLSILDVSDLVKFSKFKPEAASAYGILTSARQIVQATIPVVADDAAAIETRAADSNEERFGQKSLAIPNPSVNGNQQKREKST